MSEPDSRFPFHASFIVEAADIPQARVIAHAFLRMGTKFMKEAGWNGDRITIQTLGPGGNLSPQTLVPLTALEGEETGQLTPEQRLAYFRSKTL